MNRLQHGFEQAKATYPDAYVSGYGTEWSQPLFDDEESEEIEVAHTWQMVDACGASFRTPEREGMLVLREHRPGCKYPLHHWGFMVAKSEMKAKRVKASA